LIQFRGPVLTAKVSAAAVTSHECAAHTICGFASIAILCGFRLWHDVSPVCSKKTQRHTYRAAARPALLTRSFSVKAFSDNWSCPLLVLRHVMNDGGNALGPRARLAGKETLRMKKASRDQFQPALSLARSLGRLTRRDRLWRRRVCRRRIIHELGNFLQRVGADIFAFQDAEHR